MSAVPVELVASDAFGELPVDWPPIADPLPAVPVTEDVVVPTPAFGVAPVSALDAELVDAEP